MISLDLIIHSSNFSYESLLRTVPDLGQMRPCDSPVMRPLTWANNQRIHNNSVSMPLSEPLSYTISSIIVSVIAPKQNAFKFRIAPHKQKFIVIFSLAGSSPTPDHGALCVSSKSDTDSETDLYQV